MIIAFTGHRPQALGGFEEPNPLKNAICKAIKNKLVELKPSKAISGMALGVDQWAAEICLELEIPLFAAIPCDNHEKIWPKASQEKYKEILSKASESVIVSPGPYSVWKMQKRNEFMCDNADVIMAIWNGKSGGTGNCVRYALSQNKQIIRIDPGKLIIG